MCGRFGLFAEPELLALQFNLDPRILQEVYQRHWNISPTMQVLSVEHGSNEEGPVRNTARLMRWGMSGARSRQTRGANRPLFNARAETVHELWSFREAFRTRRCLIPASGFFEWKEAGSGSRTPVWFHREDHAPIAFAAIWSWEENREGRVETCAIITCAPNSLASPVHHRMPVILAPGSYSSWLIPDAGTDTLLSLLQPVEWPDMAWHPVSREVNRATNDYPALVESSPFPPDGDGGNLLLDLPY